MARNRPPARILLRLSLLLTIGSGCAAPASAPGPARLEPQEVEWFQRGLYAGALVGRADADASGSDLEDDLAARGHDAAVDLEDDDTAWKVLLGWRFDRPFAVELSWSDLGRVESEIAATPADVDAFLADVADVHPFLGHGVTLEGRFFPFERERVRIGIGGGLWLWEAEVEATAATGEEIDVDEDGVDPLVGIDVRVEVLERADVRAEAQRFWLDGDEADVLWLGVEVRVL